MTIEVLLKDAAAIVAIAAALTASAKLAHMLRGMMRTIATWDRLLQSVWVEFRPNGGGTLRDAIDRLEESCAAQDGRLVRVELELKALREDRTP